MKDMIMNTIRNRITAIIAVSLIVMTAVIVVLSVLLKRSAAEARRVKSDYAAEVMREYDVQQLVTRKELKEYFAGELARLKEYGIRPGQVENIVKFEYHYIDSVRYRDTLVWVFDTIKEVRCAPFEIVAGCWSIGGEIVGDTLEIGWMTHDDDILVSLYRERRKCLFERRRVKAIAVSGCSGDTLSITRNLKVSR